MTCWYNQQAKDKNHKGIHEISDGECSYIMEYIVALTVPALLLAQIRTFKYVSRFTSLGILISMVSFILVGYKLANLSEVQVTAPKDLNLRTFSLIGLSGHVGNAIF